MRKASRDRQISLALASFVARLAVIPVTITSLLVMRKRKRTLGFRVTICDLERATWQATRSPAPPGSITQKASSAFAAEVPPPSRVGLDRCFEAVELVEKLVGDRIACPTWICNPEASSAFAAEVPPP